MRETICRVLHDFQADKREKYHVMIGDNDPEAQKTEVHRIRVGVLQRAFQVAEDELSGSQRGVWGRLEEGKNND